MGLGGGARGRSEICDPAMISASSIDYYDDG